MSLSPYNLTLIKVPYSERDRFRSLTAPETYREIRPGTSGERVAYRVELTDEEYGRAQRDAADPRVNLIAVEPDQRGGVAAVPDADTLAYVAAHKADSFGEKGRGVVVGVIDSGLGSALRDGVFQGRVKAAKSEIEGDPYSDENTHGSAMAGLAVPGEAQIAVSQVINPAGQYLVSNFVAGLYWLVDEVGVDIVNMSLALPSGSVATTVSTDVINHARSRNVLLVASAGNNGDREVLYPARYRGVLAISAYDRSTDRKASFSNYGEEVFLAAPGVAVSVYEPDGSEGLSSGTSPAAAVVSGLAARLLGGGRSAGTVESYLASTARRTGGSSDYEGSGVVQYAAASNAIGYDEPQKSELPPVAPPVTPPVGTPTNPAPADPEEVSTSPLPIPQPAPAAPGTAPGVSAPALPGLDSAPSTPGYCEEDEETDEETSYAYYVLAGEVSAGTWGCLKRRGWSMRAGDGEERLYAPDAGGPDGMCHTFSRSAGIGQDCIDALYGDGWRIKSQSADVTTLCAPAWYYRA